CNTSRGRPSEGVARTNRRPPGASLHWPPAMCGICGLLETGGGAPDRDVLERMNARLFHRGPDSGGVHVEGRAGIAARRLSIIDLVTGDQPLATEEETGGVGQNGEIYNYRELRDELAAAGHHFRTNGDTEALVHAYEQWRPMFAEPLRGLLAVAIGDTREQRLVLARDRFGIKPLYYRVAGGTLS